MQDFGRLLVQIVTKTSGNTRNFIEQNLVKKRGFGRGLKSSQNVAFR